MNELYSAAELHALTDYARCGQQAAWLAEHGIPHKVDDAALQNETNQTKGGEMKDQEFTEDEVDQIVVWVIENDPDNPLARVLLGILAICGTSRAERRRLGLPFSFVDKAFDLRYQLFQEVLKIVGASNPVAIEKQA